MKKRIVIIALPIAACIWLFGCNSPNDDGDGDLWDQFDSDDDDTSFSEELGYVCIGETDEIDTDECGPYPEEQAWDLDRVVSNITFNAYYDRDCDGEAEATTMNMYRDIYCNRDKIKSVVLMVGSNCGEQQGAEP